MLSHCLVPWWSSCKWQSLYSTHLVCRIQPMKRSQFTLTHSDVNYLAHTSIQIFHRQLFEIKSDKSAGKTQCLAYTFSNNNPASHLIQSSCNVTTSYVLLFLMSSPKKGSHITRELLMANACYVVNSSKLLPDAC